MYATNIDTRELEWTPLDFVGVHMRTVHLDRSTNRMVVMTRMAAGAEIPAHKHTNADESVYVLEGDFVEDGVSYSAGTFFADKAGTVHGPHRSVNGCVVLTTFLGTLDFLMA